MGLVLRMRDVLLVLDVLHMVCVGGRAVMRGGAVAALLLLVAATHFLRRLRQRRGGAENGQRGGRGSQIATQNPS